MVHTAFIFPGQGSQSIGMLADFVPHYSIVTELFAQASETLGYDLWHLIQNGPEEQLNQTKYTQVAMLVADVAVYSVVQQYSIAAPQFMAGHSLGEYPALVCAGALSLENAVRLVAHRGRIMQHAIPKGTGAMAAIVGLTDEQITELCHQASREGQQVTPANYNAIGQVVVAGHTPAVERLIDLADKAEARLAKIIPVSVPCHCPLLTEAAEEFSQILATTEFKTPSVKVISNVDLSLYSSVEHIRSKLKEQLYSPVRWVETMQYVRAQGVELVLEIGPGKVLGGLVKRIDRSLKAASVYDTMSLQQVLNDYMNTTVTS